MPKEIKKSIDQNRNPYCNENKRVGEFTVLKIKNKY